MQMHVRSNTTSRHKNVISKIIFGNAVGVEALCKGKANLPRTLQETIMLGGLLSLIHLIVWIWAAINIWQSTASTLAKVLWTLLVLVAPVIGLIIWFLIGPKSN